MRLFSSARARQRGFAVILAVLSLLILGVLATGFIVGSITEHRMSLNEMDATSAVQLADGGARAAFQWLANQNPPPCSPGATVTPVGTVYMGTAGRAVPTITYADTNDCSNDYQGWGCTIRSVGTTPGGRQATVELKAEIARKTATCYAIYLGEYCPMPDRTTWFGDYDRVTGPVHSNCRLWLAQRDPPAWTGAQFWGRVTIVAPDFLLAGFPHGSSTNPTSFASFYDGYQTNQEAHDWPPSLSGTISCAGTAQGGYTLTGETWLRFKPNGKVDIKNSHERPYDDLYPAYYTDVDRPHTGVIRIVGPANTNPDIHVEGTYVGKWTLICQRSVYFDGDLMPLRDPRFGPSPDIMGVIPSEQAVGLEGKMIIPDVNPAGVDGDRSICAYVMVPRREGSWEVTNYDTRAREGILLLMGGISFGYIGPTETADYQHGYGTDLWYDNRACEGNNPPPCFPELVTEQGNRPIWNVAQIDSTWREVY